MKALISVYDKTGVIEAARRLHDAGVGLVSTGGTHKAISDASVPVQQVSDLDGLPGNPGRAGQDPSSPYPQRTAGTQGHAGTHGRAVPPGHSPYRFADWQPVSLQGSHKQARRHAGRRPGEHRHRRADDAPRRGEELPQRGGSGGPCGLRLGHRQICEREPKP